MAAIEEFSVGYPVKFWTGGDTTRDAFGRLIQEIERIYGILNALGTGKASYEEIASAVSAHKYESNPHPNWKPSMSFSDLAGSVDASKVLGKLPNATIDAGKVNGLEAYVKGLIPDTSGNNESGITDSSLNDSGYIKFGNGLMFQWGICSMDYNNETILGNGQNPGADGYLAYGGQGYAKFHTAFPSKSLNITVTPVWAVNRPCGFTLYILPDSLTSSGFGYSYTHDGTLTNKQISLNVKMRYFAVGV